MPHIFAFLTVFVLFAVLTAEKVSAAPSESVGSEAMFSTGVDMFLGQNTRRRGGGGRVWSNLYYGDTTLKPKEEDKINPDFYGVQVGFDLAQSHGTYSTFFLNVNQTRTKFEEDPSTINNYLLGYGKFFYMSGCHFVLTGSVGYDRYKIGSTDTASGDGLQTNVFGEFGFNFPFGKWSFKPFYALQYDFLYRGNISEQSSVVLGDWNGHGLNQLLGLRTNWRICDRLDLQSRAVWVHEMLDNPPPFYHARFSPMHGVNTPAIMYYQGNTGRDWAWLGIGGKLEGAFNVYLFLDYDILLNERHITHLGSFGLCFGW